jgi:hypothetical protein
MGGGIGGAVGVIGATVSALDGRFGATTGEAAWIAVGDTTGSDGAVLVVTSDVVDVSGGGSTGTVAGG